MGGLKEERFEINPSTTGVTAGNGQGATWHADIWDYKVPLNQEIILKSTDIFSCYLVGDDVVEMPDTTLVRIVKRDVANEDAKPMLTNALYKTCQAFTDKALLMTLNPPGGEVIVGAEEHIVIMVNGADVDTGGDVDASASHFKIVTTRRRKGI